MTVTSDAPAVSPEVPDEPSGSDATDTSTEQAAQSQRSPVSHWTTAEVLNALQSGDLSDWQAIVHALKRDPFGRTARQIEEVVGADELYGISTALQEIIARARDNLAESERREAANEINLLFEASGLREAEFASRIGVSNTELSAYLAGTSLPSVAMLVRMRRVARRFGRTRPRG
ncbi:helix-turn-helix transcriptional regulator [Mycobacterium sp. CBMA271]|uniref:helix-turn-helix domain-containing protein n=1 Tax=unclassified Mycobacteroides TaxID=2618759 RepID=UPI0013290958|nr:MULTISPECIES: helix-turn-helix transcriptional regulator [unclassified Mycobacteroides]MUM19120.1 transcriptional regulator [Mycobacteroides sp. CBMA 326]MUM21534.1 helix-turn-helix transcriptional regulator [Mycobacteroides sp. CBMA 271]